MGSQYSVIYWIYELFPWAWGLHLREDMKLIMIQTTLMCFLLVGTIPAFADIGKGSVIAAAGVKVRSTPGGKRFTGLRRGQRFSVLRQSGNWYEVMLPSGQKGWIYKSGIRVVRTETPETSMAKTGASDAPAKTRVTPGSGYVISRKGVNIRSGPDGSDRGGLKRGQKFAILGRSGDWYQVRLSSGKEGWVHRSGIEVTRLPAKVEQKVAVPPPIPKPRPTDSAGTDSAVADAAPASVVADESTTAAGVDESRDAADTSEPKPAPAITETKVDSAAAGTPQFIEAKAEIAPPAIDSTAKTAAPAAATDTAPPASAPPVAPAPASPKTDTATSPAAREAEASPSEAVPPVAPEAPAKSIYKQSAQQACAFLTNDLQRRNCLSLFKPNSIFEDSVKKEALLYTLAYFRANKDGIKDKSCAQSSDKRGGEPKMIRNQCSFVINVVERKWSLGSVIFPHRTKGFFIDLCAQDPKKVLRSMYVNKGTGETYKDVEGAKSTVAGAFLTDNQTRAFTPYTWTAAYRAIPRKNLIGLDVTPLHSTNNDSADSKPIHVSPYRSSSGCPSVNVADVDIIRTLAKNGPSLWMNYGQKDLHPEDSITKCDAVPDKNKNKKRKKKADFLDPETPTTGVT